MLKGTSKMLAPAGGDDNDGKLNGKRTIAFAYGAQYSFTSC